MSDKDDGYKLVGSKIFEDDTTRMDKDADALEKQWKTQLASTVFGGFPAGFLNEYKNDGAMMVKARGAFNAEVLKVTAKRGDLKKMYAACDMYTARIEALRQSNARFEAVIALNVGPLVEALLKVMKAYGMLCREKLAKLKEKLEELEVLVEEADKECTKAEAKLLLNAMLSAITIAITATGPIGRIGEAAIGITGHIVIEFALGQGSAKGIVTPIIGDSPDLINKLEEIHVKFLGAVAAALAAKFDAEELGEAFDHWEALVPKMMAARAEFDQAMNSLMGQLPYLQKVDASLKAFPAAMKKALEKKADATKGYDAIKAAIKKIM